MPSPFEPFLSHRGFVLLDGGLATALEDRGQDLVDPLWSARVLLDDPAAVSAVHRDYLEAGADCIATVTYQLTFEALADRGIPHDRAEALFSEAVDLAVVARDAFWGTQAPGEGRHRPLVAASVGPYGAFLADGSEYDGRYGLDRRGLISFHRDRWAVLASSGADLLGCETIPSLTEVHALLDLLDSTPGRWAWMSMQCRDGAHLADGSPLVEAVRACHAAERVAAVGVNCVPPERVPGLLAHLTSETDKPVMVYPNSGESYDATTKRWTSGAARLDFVQAARTWREAGATVLGGCCRTGPDTIRDLRRHLVDGNR